MHKSKLYEQLEAGRLIIRMNLGDPTSLFVTMDMYCLVTTPAGINTVTKLVTCGFTATSHRVDPLKFRVISERGVGETDSLAEDWRVNVASRWPYYWADGQIICSAIKEETENVLVPSASIQALPHYARCIDQLNLFVASARNESQELEFTRHILLKLRTIYEGLVKTWGQCVTFV